MEFEDQKQRKRSWWQCHAKPERRLAMTTLALSLTLTLLAISAYIILTHTPGNKIISKRSIKSKSKVCVSEACVRASAKLLDSIDPSADPCDDFQQFACGKYMEASMQDGEPVATGEIERMKSNALRRFEHLFDEPLKANDSIAHKNLKYLYATCMNQTQIDRGVKYLKQSLIKELGGWPLITNNWNDANFNWTNTIAKLRRLGFRYNLFFQLKMHTDYTKNRNYLKIISPTMSQGMLLLVILVPMSFRNENEALLKRAVGLFGGNKMPWETIYDIKLQSNFTEELTEIISKYQLARTQPVEHELQQPANLISLSQVETLSPQVPWTKLLRDITGYNLTSKHLVEFNITNYIQELDTLLKKTPRRIQANYIIWEVLKSMSRWFNLSIPWPTSTVRRKTCIKEVEEIMPWIANQVLSEKDSAVKQRDKILQMIKTIRKEIKNQVNNSNYSWMNNEMKNFTIKKIQKIKLFAVGKLESYEDFGIDYGNKEIFDSNGNFITAISNAKLAFDQFQYDIMFNKSVIENTIVGLISLDSSANAYYIHNNYISIPTGVLYEMYDAQLPAYVNYARMGYFIGHELSHVLSQASQMYGMHGETNKLWTNRTKINNKNYFSAHQCLTDLYENYTNVKYGVKSSGLHSLDENVADMIGSRASYEVFQKLEHRGTVLPAMEGYTKKQLFWMVFARFYCDPEEDVKSAKAEVAHGLSSFRIFSTLSNSHQFAADFNCPTGSRMNPAEKCNPN